MLLRLSLSAFLLVSGVAAQTVISGTAGTTTTTWDCCKPACGWISNLPPGTKGPVHACSITNAVLTSTGTQSACDGGTAYSCSSFQPQIVNDTFSLGFAGHGSTPTSTCCKCYQFTWTSGAPKGKSMIVQAVNAFGVSAVDFDIYTPGGGVGDFNACTAQYDAPSPNAWGRQFGGVTSAADCAALPEELRAGCRWRFEWTGGDFNMATTLFEEVACPAELTGVSGCFPPS